MLPHESLAQFHQKHLHDYAAQASQFNVYAIAPDLDPPFVPLSRRDFFQVNLYTSGRTHFDYAGTRRQVEGPVLVFYNRSAPYACNGHEELTGFYCLFTADFLHGSEYTPSLLESPLFQLGADPVYPLTAAQCDFLSALFRQMLAEAGSPYRYKHDLLRTYLQLVLHEALRLQPEPSLASAAPATRLAGQFLQLLAQQFPITSPARPLRLHHAEGFAAELGVHVNYLSRVLREVTGRPTSAHLAERITQEAKALLRHTDWPVADIADSLGFANPTYFTNFFHKHTDTSPTGLRQQYAAQSAAADPEQQVRIL